MDHSSFTTCAHEARPGLSVKHCCSTLTTVVAVARQAKGAGAADGCLRVAYPKNALRTSKGHISCDAVSLSGVHGGVFRSTDSDDLWVDGGIEAQVASLISLSTYLPLRVRLAEHPDDIVEMVDQITDALHSLRYDAFMLHCDVSNTNIMWEETANGQGHFVLHGFDLAVPLNPDGTPAMEATAKHRTGTLPFMSVFLLEDMWRNPDSPGVMHELHHDYESLFWVATWCTMKTEHDIAPKLKEQVETVVTKWETDSYQAIAWNKEDVLFGFRLKDLPMTPRFERLRPVLRVFRKVFKEANEAIVDDDFGRSRAEILREWITRSKIKDIMGKAKVKASVGIAG
ncbi:uncharacterized protein TRAVEDRAFT_53418 [Trametes versicolor FP-101664 SS1]|uniref:uncharacterized protein n=1 Tax=Trametes versicolor (strain FP-101664) TaxID=717944 RepID=UPI000462429F|nr:uncharacterized protein TRAVEDRAFT_53418 [Trametes versicolor FP-101664 SS1]EIW53000.1 hypothetical protein TRAVEDRAFT_53418 [Trametes versicolor FP-101664 SS1]